MKNKVKTAAKKKIKGGFTDARKHSDNMQDYRVGKFPSTVATAESPFKENKADVELKKLVSNNKMFPKGETPETNKRRYAWSKSGSGRKA